MGRIDGYVFDIFDTTSGLLLRFPKIYDPGNNGRSNKSIIQ